MIERRCLLIVHLRALSKPGESNDYLIPVCFRSRYLLLCNSMNDEITASNIKAEAARSGGTSANRHRRSCTRDIEDQLRRLRRGRETTKPAFRDISRDGN